MSYIYKGTGFSRLEILEFLRLQTFFFQAIRENLDRGRDGMAIETQSF